MVNKDEYILRGWKLMLTPGCRAPAYLWFHPDLVEACWTSFNTANVFDICSGVHFISTGLEVHILRAKHYFDCEGIGLLNILIVVRRSKYTTLKCVKPMASTHISPNHCVVSYVYWMIKR